MNSRPSWDDQRIFLAVLEAGSLSAAARRLGLSHPTVRSRVEALETALGTTLFTRSARGLTPTPGALALREPARAMAMASEAFIRTASAAAGEIAGTVRISVPEFMGVEVVPQMLLPLRDRHPALRIELSLSDGLADLLSQEVDLAVRTVAPTQVALVARKAARIPLGFFAAPAYLARQGTPASLAELDRHDLIGPDRNRADFALVERHWPGFDRARVAVRTDSHPAQIAAARAGLGIAVVQVPAGLSDPGLTRVLPEIAIAHLDTWIVAHEDLRQTGRVRAAFDALVEGFAKLTGP